MADDTGRPIMEKMVLKAIRRYLRKHFPDEMDRIIESTYVCA